MILYTAAHGGFSGEGVPLGGGAAVFDHLVEEWTRTQPFAFRTITPAILASSVAPGAPHRAPEARFHPGQAPSGRDLVHLSEREYARFCDAFEHAATSEIMRHDPASTVVLSNDVSEGPDFAALAARGYRVFTIYHVDVVAYVAAMYLHGWIAPQTTVRWARRMRPVLPRIARLIWEKQEASVRNSRGLIVPSEGMRDVLVRCYPECSAERIHVLPWGTFESGTSTWPERVSATALSDALRAEFGVPRDARVLLTLSRISPEKGQDLLLESLLEWDPPIWVFICGGAAYMQGKRFLQKLERLASRFRRTRVVFPGHVTGERKRAFFALADVYVFPSRHESYGLTLVEALASGTPAVCLDSMGARSVMREEFGAVVRQDQLRAAIERLMGDDALRRKMGETAREFAATQPFSDQAAKLVGILTR